MDAAFPSTKDLVLIGGGHAHALVLKRWGMRPLPGARLTLINPGPDAPYTGMLPGHVAGHYPADALMIDMVRLARFAGARLILGAAQGIDREARLLHIPGRPPVAYDLASVNVGITSDLPDLPGFAEHAIAAKPLGPFARRWAAFRGAVTARPRIAVIGGGVGGVELALAMAHALRADAPSITVIDRSAALPGLTPSARAALLCQMGRAGVHLLEHTTPTKITAEAIHLADGQAIPSQFTVGVAGARPHPWLASTGLADAQGFLPVNAQLQTADPAIFAAGDCAALPDPRPKAGVFAVREAPILAHNLRAALQGRARLRPYRPQKSYLKLISLGGKSALADKWSGRLKGGWAWRWKDRIDRRFMRQFQSLAPMASPPLPRDHAEGLPEALGAKPLCAGCGSKVGSGTLGQSLRALPKLRADILSLPGDDAAIVQLGGARQVITLDHLRAFTDDPYLMAKIAAVHALGDVWAMGAAPQAALSTLILPRMAEPLQARTLAEITAGAAEVFAAAGAEIAGGHTTLGPELTIGFTVTGLLEGPAITLAGAAPGDALILTKPIGSGTVLAAEMQLAARGSDVAATLDQMQRPQGEAAKILAGAHAMTDVTGFGLAGHLMNICAASGLAARLDLAALPTLPGAEALAAQGIRSSLYPQNRAVADRMTLPLSPKADLLFDPQTAGGLLAAVPAAEAQRTLERLHGADFPAAQIGSLTEGAPQITVCG